MQIQQVTFSLGISTTLTSRLNFLVVFTTRVACPPTYLRELDTSETTPAGRSLSSRKQAITALRETGGTGDGSTGDHDVELQQCV
jgi:hypothetical protein